MIESVFGPYEGIAGEYYDEELHPTCANFRKASAAILASWLSALDLSGMTVCEVGAGNSLLVEILGEQSARPSHVLLFDRSPSMLLQTTSKITNYGGPIEVVIGDAGNLSIRDDAVDVIVVSLGDPFNSQSFWSEVERVLRRGGLVAYTTPSHRWAEQFRTSSAQERPGAAKYVLLDGAVVYAPSYILNQCDQLDLIASVGLTVLEEQQITVAQLGDERISYKLLVDGPDLPVVEGYLAQKMR